MDAINSKDHLFNIIDHASNFKADFVILKNDEFRKEEFSRKIKMDYFGKTVYVVSPEDLLISKLIWIQEYQPPVQIEDIKNLAEIDSLDWPYISKWINKLKLNTFGLFSQ